MLKLKKLCKKLWLWKILKFDKKNYKDYNFRKGECMKVIGVGNTGSKLAMMLDESSLLFSTADQDTNNFLKRNNVVVISNEGASKRFKTGVEIWNKNQNKLKEALSNIKNENVILFSALGGGSGSSSLTPISKILLEQNCKVLIVGILPFKKEVNPPLANGVLALNNIMPIIDKVSVLIFDNEKLLKQYDGEWRKINEHIIQTVDYIINLLVKYNTDNYSPVTIDQSELNSVIFGGGFLDFSDTFVEETNPKFEYGSLNKSTKNCLICMFVDDKIEDRNKVDDYQNILSDIIIKFGRKVPNARMIPGILRGNITDSGSENNVDDRCYFVIASGLGVEPYLKKIEKMRDEAMKRATIFSEKEKGSKFVDNKSAKMLDI